MKERKELRDIAQRRLLASISLASIFLRTGAMESRPSSWLRPRRTDAPKTKAGACARTVLVFTLMSRLQRYMTKRDCCEGSERLHATSPNAGDPRSTW